MPNKKQLVVLFQRGAADGLNIVVPFGESNYYSLRPTIAIPQPKRGGRASGFALANPDLNTDAAIDLDDFSVCTRASRPSSRSFTRIN